MGSLLCCCFHLNKADMVEGRHISNYRIDNLLNHNLDAYEDNVMRMGEREKIYDQYVENFY